MSRFLVLLALVLALALAGCGFGAGPAPKGAGTELTVSRNFGADEMGSSKRKTIPAGETVMRLLQRSFEVKTRYGGGFVQSIDGVATVTVPAGSAAVRVTAERDGMVRSFPVRVAVA